MRLNKISRRRFLKGAGVAALAVAAAGMLTGCGSSSGGKKVEPNPTPVTKPVDVKYVLDETGETVCTDTINLNVTKVDAANPVVAGNELSLPEEYAKDYSIMDGEYPITKTEDGKYELTVIVAKVTVPAGKEQVPVVFYVKYINGTEDDVTDKVLKGRTVLVDVDATEVDVSDMLLPDDCDYEIHDTTAKIKVEDGKRVARVWVSRKL